MNRIVITGATSMIGTALIEECLKHKIEIYAVVRKDSPKLGRLPKAQGLHLVEGDLENLSSLPERIGRQCDTFYHIAWGYTGENRNKSTELQSHNIYYTLEAVKAAKDLGCSRFIGAGSQAEYGLLDMDRIGPDTPTDPTTPYGASKLAAANLSAMLCRELELEWIWPRIFSVYGIHEKPTTMIGGSLRKMLRGEDAQFTPAEQRWDYLYSKDAGRAYYLIGEKGRPGSIYCVGSGQARALKTYIEEMARLTGASSVGIGARPYPPKAVMNLCADIDSLTADTGFTPSYSFGEGIQETIAWLRQSREV